MTALLLGAAVLGVAFLATVARHERRADRTGITPGWREVTVEGLLLGPAIGCALGWLASWVLP
jgi:hypothetical protein